MKAWRDPVALLAVPAVLYLLLSGSEAAIGHAEVEA